MAHQGKNRGFTLIELSIVLVVIGLIVGGVLVGQDLIKAAQLRKNTSFVEEVNTAVMTFKLKYNALPGDMLNATQQWGAKADCTPDTPRSTDGTTCNGDGNGALDQDLERHCFWQHLSNAGLMSGNYTCSVLGVHAFVEGDLPITKGANGYWSAGQQLNFRYHVYSAMRIEDIGNLDLPVFTPSEAFQMDSKVDDGLPLTGTWRQLYVAGCATINDAATAKFDFSNTDVACALEVKAGF